MSTWTPFINELVQYCVKFIILGVIAFLGIKVGAAIRKKKSEQDIQE